MGADSATVIRFRKKPVEITAVQWTGGNEDALKAFTGGRFNSVLGAATAGCTGEVYDVLHETWVGVRTGQWVIRGVKGEMYPIAEDVLAETYERIGAVDGDS